MLALCTSAFKVDGEISNFEAGAARVGQPNSSEFRILEINNGVATSADQVVVIVGIAVKLSGALEMLRSFGHTELNQRFQHPIYRGSRHPRHASFHIFKNLIDRRMIVAFDQSTQNDLALHGHGYSPFAAQ